MPDDANEPGLLVLEACYLQMPLHIIYITDYERQKRKLKSNLMAKKMNSPIQPYFPPWSLFFLTHMNPKLNSTMITKRSNTE